MWKNSGEKFPAPTSSFHFLSVERNFLAIFVDTQPCLLSEVWASPQHQRVPFYHKNLYPKHVLKYTESFSALLIARVVGTECFGDSQGKLDLFFHVTKGVVASQPG